jgi:hypothetical protein
MKSWGVVGFVGFTCNSQGRSQPLLAVSERPSSPTRFGSAMSALSH